MSAGRWIGRAIVTPLALPAGLFLLAFPFYQLAVMPGGWAIVDDTRAALGAGVPSTLKAEHVDCVMERSGGRRGSITEYACVIDIAGPVPPAPAEPPKRTGGSRYTGYQDPLLAALRNPRPGARLERRLPTDHTGELPMVRELSEEPRRYALVWGAGEITGRWLYWLFTRGLALAFGAVCLFAVWVTWRR